MCKCNNGFIRDDLLIDQFRQKNKNLALKGFLQAFVIVFYYFCNGRRKAYVIRLALFPNVVAHKLPGNCEIDRKVTAHTSLSSAAISFALKDAPSCEMTS